MSWRWNVLILLLFHFFIKCTCKSLWTKASKPSSLNVNVILPHSIQHMHFLVFPVFLWLGPDQHLYALCSCVCGCNVVLLWIARHLAVFQILFTLFYGGGEEGLGETFTRNHWQPSDASESQKSDANAAITVVILKGQLYYNRNWIELNNMRFRRWKTPTKKQTLMHWFQWFTLKRIHRCSRCVLMF